MPGLDDFRSDSEPRTANSELPTLLQMRSIRKAFPGVVALEGVDFDLRAGEVHVLVGENGAGKSTLIKILGGAYRADSGEIHIDGFPVRLGSPRQAQDLGIRIIHQELNLVPHLTAAENIFLGDEPHRGGVIRRREVERRSSLLLEELGAPFPVEVAVSSLSVAQQQLVEIAKALSRQARILVMDEPTSALSDGEIGQLFAAVKRLKARGTGIVYISHRLEEIFQIGDRVTVLRDGRLVETRVAAALEASVLVRLMTDREVGEHFPRRRPHLGSEVLRVEDLSDGSQLRGVDFSLRSGEVLGLAGLMGAGRTALARCLFGAQRIAAGRVWMEGRPLHPRTPVDAISRGIGFLPEDRKSQGLILQLSVADNIALPNLDSLSRIGVVSRAAASRLTRTSLADLQIKCVSEKQEVAFLSGGNQQKVALAKWLARRCRVLLFDEPTRGIDVGAKVEIYNLINRLAQEGSAILLISSELPELLGMSDRILVMRQGRISACFETAKASQEEVLQAAL